MGQKREKNGQEQDQKDKILFENKIIRRGQRSEKKNLYK